MPGRLFANATGLYGSGSTSAEACMVIGAARDETVIIDGGAKDTEDESMFGCV